MSLTFVERLEPVWQSMFEPDWFVVDTTGGMFSIDPDQRIEWEAALDVGLVEVLGAPDESLPPGIVRLVGGVGLFEGDCGLAS